MELPPYPLKVAILYDRDLAKIRLLVYDDTNQILLHSLSEFLSDDDELIRNYAAQCDEAVAQIIQEYRSAYGEEVVDSIIKEECKILASTEGILKEEERSSDISTPPSYFGTEEFEEELSRLFEDSELCELWLISPWIKRKAFVEERAKRIKKFLAQKEDRRIRLIFSMPEQVDGAGMIDEESERELLKIQKEFKKRFQVAQFPKFHFKNVFAVSYTNRVRAYSGSFNVLSFSGFGYHSVRAEEMILLPEKEGLEKLRRFSLEFDQYCYKGEASVAKKTLKESSEEPTTALETLSLSEFKLKLDRQIEQDGGYSKKEFITKETREIARRFLESECAFLRNYTELLRYLAGASCATVLLKSKGALEFARNRDIYLNTIIEKASTFEHLRIFERTITGKLTWVFSLGELEFQFQSFVPNEKSLAILRDLNHKSLPSAKFYHFHINTLIKTLSICNIKTTPLLKASESK